MKHEKIINWITPRLVEAAESQQQRPYYRAVTGTVTVESVRVKVPMSGGSYDGAVYGSSSAYLVATYWFISELDGELRSAEHQVPLIDFLEHLA